jgi:NitT/TauT family transport system ATP-binding protein
MDEPLAAVDSQTRVLLQSEIARIWAAENEAGRHRTVIWITHSIEEAVFLSDRVAVMSRRPGRVRKIIDVNLPRPRSEMLHADLVGAELCEQIWSLIRDEAKDALMEM